MKGVAGSALPDLIAALLVFCIVGFNLNRATVTCQEKMMRGLQMIEAHRLVPTFVHLVHLLLRHGARSWNFDGRQLLN